MKRVSAKGIVWAVAAFAAVTVGLHAGPLPWRFAGESGLGAPDPASFARSPEEVASIEPILALAPFGRITRAVEPDAVAEETALGLVLHGVVIATRPEGSSAIISTPDQPARAYAVGETVTPEASLADVQPDHVVLLVDGRSEILSFPKVRTAGSATGNSGAAALRALVTAGGAQGPEAEPPARDPDAVIARYRERIQANPQTVLDGLGLEATAAGYRVGEGASSGVRRAGLKLGDLVEKVNGQQVGNIERDRDLFDEVAASGRARIEVVRDGQRVVMSFPLR